MRLTESDAERQRSMRVVERAVYGGPHLYSATPMVRMQLDLGALGDRPTSSLPEFSSALVAALPGLASHGCSYNRRGGFLRRMTEGTWLGHVAEHVALELQCLAGFNVARGKTRSVKSRPGVYNVMFAYGDADVALAAGRVALELIDSLLPKNLQGCEGLDLLCRPLSSPFDFRRAKNLLIALGKRRQLGPTTRALVEEARRRHIPVTRLDRRSLHRLGWGTAQKAIRASITSDTSHVAVETAGDKHLTKQLLKEIGIPTPDGRGIAYGLHGFANGIPCVGGIEEPP